MHSTCPTVSATRWASLGHAVYWLCIHREELEAYMEEKDAQVAPDDVWSDIIVSVNAFMGAVNECFRSIQVRDTLLIKQNERLQMLSSDLKCLVGIRDPLNSMSLLSAVGGNELLVSVLAPEGHFVVSESTVAPFLENISFDSSDDKMTYSTNYISVSTMEIRSNGAQSMKSPNELLPIASLIRPIGLHSVS